MADALVQLNANWRVSDDPPQWTIEQRIGNASAKDSGWRARKFIRNTDHLLKRISEMCGNVDRAAIEIMQSWSSEYVTWKVMEMQGSGGPVTGPWGVISVGQHLRTPDVPQCVAYDGNHEQRQGVSG